jgi:tetratricopeptide (TPR) repeat protein
LEGVIASYLNFPDHADDHRAFNYSTQVAQALHHAYSHVKHKQLGGFEANLEPLLMWTMTPVQRMRLLFVLSLAAYHFGAYAPALDYASAGLDIAHRQGDAGSCAILAKLAGKASHELQHFGAAHTYFLQVMSALSELQEAPGDSLERYDILGWLAIDTFLLAQYDTALQYLHYARDIAPSRDGMQQTARLDWMDALVYRWHRQPFSAFQAIQSAAHTYETGSDPSERGRFHIVYADIALDCSEYSEGIGGAGSAFLRLADTHIAVGLRDVLTVRDLSGEGLALLAQARHMLLTHRNEDDRATLDKVETIAGQLHDMPLLTQAYTARGDAFAVRGEIAPALACYRKALDASAGSDARAFIAKPQRSLLMLQEMHGEQG